MMRYLTITFAVFALAAQTAQAGHLGLGWGDLGLGGHRDGYHHGGEFGHGGDFGGFGFDTEQLQSRFETRFDVLQNDYDMGLADIEDFYSSDKYGDVVDGMEHLVDRYDLFLSGIDRSIDRLGDFISIASDDLAYYDELIADYEARTDLSQTRLERILSWLTAKQDRLTTKIDLLTEKQTTLSENLPTYQSFSTDLSTYLTDIVSAGGGTTGDATVDTTTALLSMAALSSATPLTALADDPESCDTSVAALSAAAAPEPASTVLCVMAIVALLARRPRRTPDFA